jgi:hypothetical protein
MSSLPCPQNTVTGNENVFRPKMEGSSVEPHCSHPVCLVLYRQWADPPCEGSYPLCNIQSLNFIFNWKRQEHLIRQQYSSGSGSGSGTGTGSGYFATDVQSASVLVSGPHLGPTTRFSLLSDIWGLLVVRRPPWREDWSVIYSYN